MVKERVRRDRARADRELPSRLRSLEGVGSPEAQEQLNTAFKHGFQSREAEMSLGRLMSELADR